MPVVLLALLGAIQVANISYARSIALNAAEEAANAARAYDAAPGAGQARAASFLARAGHGSLLDPRVSVTVTATDVTVVVTGAAPRLIPGLPLHVRQTAHGTRERFTTGAAR